MYPGKKVASFDWFTAVITREAVVRLWGPGSKTMRWVVEKGKAVELIVIEGKARHPQGSLRWSFEIEQSSRLTNPKALAKELDGSLKMFDDVAGDDKVELVVR